MRQLYTILAMCAMGEGILALLFPRRYAQIWKIGPEPLRNAAQFFADNPQVTRAAGAAEVASALWLARRQLRD